MSETSDPSGDEAADGRRPVLRVVRGDATAEEVAAVLAVVLARAARPDPGPRPPASRWGAGGGWRSAPAPDWRTSYWPG